MSTTLSDRLHFSFTITALLTTTAIFAFGSVTGICDNMTGAVFGDGAELVMVEDGYGFTEGPACAADGTLYFSDFRQGKIFRMKPGGKPEVFHEGKYGPVGLAVAPDGSLLVCANRWHCIIAITPDGTVTRYTDRYAGKLLNSPNDIWCDAKGGAYFTDPRFVPLDEPVEQDGYHVYYLAPGGAKIVRAADEMTMPNGIVGSPDGSLVYVADTEEKKTFVYSVQPDGTLANRRLFAPEGEDGLAADSVGNVYILTLEGISVYSPDGVRIDGIDIPGKPTNAAFGGPDRHTLYITGRKTVLSIRTKTRGM